MHGKIEWKTGKWRRHGSSEVHHIWHWWHHPIGLGDGFHKFDILDIFLVGAHRGGGTTYGPERRGGRSKHVRGGGICLSGGGPPIVGRFRITDEEASLLSLAMFAPLILIIHAEASSAFFGFQVFWKKCLNICESPLFFWYFKNCFNFVLFFCRNFLIRVKKAPSAISSRGGISSIQGSPLLSANLRRWLRERETAATELLQAPSRPLCLAYYCHCLHVIAAFFFC